MPLTIGLNVGAVPVPQRVPPARVVQEARAMGMANADHAVALTQPRITIDQTGLHYRTTSQAGTPSFQFDTGILRITLHQVIFMDNTLSGCAEGHWLGHEQDHARDNQNIVRKLEPKIRAMKEVQGVWVNPAWHPRSTFQAVQARLEKAIGDLFRAETSKAVQARDTLAEYRRVQRAILTGCPGPFHHTVERQESLSWLALYYYGRASAWPTIWNANRAIIGSNPDLVAPGQVLVIPTAP